MTIVPDSVTWTVPYTPPYDWPAILAFFRARAIDGVEDVEGGVYRRTLDAGGGIVIIQVADAPRLNALQVTGARDAQRRVVQPRVERAFDVRIDPGPVGDTLARDALIAPLVARRPGLRVPGAWDPFELGVRAILGQQISVAAARRLASRLVALCGANVPDADADPADRLRYAFPTAQQIFGADLDALGMPAARRTALRSFARAALDDETLFDATGPVEHAVRRFRSIEGIGEWTAQYIAMRASRHADAFPATDIGLIRGAAAVLGWRPTAGDLLKRADAWRPWRAYAAQHLWSVDLGIGKNALKRTDD